MTEESICRPDPQQLINLLASEIDVCTASGYPNPILRLVCIPDATILNVGSIRSAYMD